MTLDGLLTFLGLVVAVFALMPTERRWMITLRGPLVWVGSAVALALSIYLELFFVALGPPCPAALGGACRWLELATRGDEAAGRLTAAQLAFLVVTLWLALAGWIAWRQQIGPGALPRLADTVVEKLAEGQHGAVVQLVYPNIDVLERAAGGRLPSARLREHLRRLDPFQDDVEAERVRAGRGPPRAASLLALVSRLRWLVPDPSKVERAAHDALRAVFTTPQVAEFLATAHPMTGVRLLGVTSSPVVHDFSGALFRRMLETPPLSHLYRELPLNQNVSTEAGYGLPPHNVYLHFLFADARDARRLAAGEDLAAAAQDLLEDKDYAASLSRTSLGFSQEGKWRDPVFATIRFLDIQARAVAVQGLRWDAATFDMTHLLEALLETYPEGVDENPPDEDWPTRVDVLIHALFVALTEWAELPQHLPAGSPHRTLESEAPTPQDDSVPKSAMLVLGECLHQVVFCEALPERRRDELFEVVLRSIAEYPQADDLAAFRRAYVNAVVHSDPWEDEDEAAYRQGLDALFHHQAFVLQDCAKDLAAAILLDEAPV